MGKGLASIVGLACCAAWGQEVTGNRILPVKPAEPAARPFIRPFITTPQRVDYFVWKTVGPMGLAQALLACGVQTWRNSPAEWGPHWDGYSKRVGSKFARIGISNGIEFGVGAALREDPRYFSLGKGPSVGARLKHALASTVLVYKPDGGRALAVGRISGKVGSGFLANTWYPPSQNQWANALGRVGTGLAFHAGFNVLKEFWPLKKRR
jgi:hypothetical protein